MVGTDLIELQGAISDASSTWQKSSVKYMLDCSSRGQGSAAQGIDLRTATTAHARALQNFKVPGAPAQSAM